MSEKDRVEEFQEALEKTEEKEHSEEESCGEEVSKNVKIGSYLLVILIGVVLTIYAISIFSTTTVWRTVIIGTVGPCLSLFGPFVMKLYWRKKETGKALRRNYKFKEKIIPLNEEAYVLGTAVPAKDEYPESKQKAVVKKTKTHDKLLISDKKEEEIINTKSKSSKALLAIGTIGLFFSVLLIIGNIYFFLQSIIAGLITLSITLLITYASQLLFRTGFKDIKSQEEVKITSTSNIGSLAMGLVEIKGKVKSIGTVKAPITGTKCAGYRVEVYKLVSTGKNSHWKPILTKNNYKPFYLEDETGKIRVDPTNGEILIEPHFKKKTIDLRELPEPGRDFLGEGGVPEIEWKEDSPVGY